VRLGTGAPLPYTIPDTVWLQLRTAPILYYRLRVLAEGQAQPAQSTLADLDWEDAPFVLVGANRLNPLASIQPRSAGVLTSDPPLVFGIAGGTQLFFTVELATDFHLFLLDNVYDRHSRNFFSSALGMPGVPARDDLMTANGIATYTIPAPVWDELRRNPRLYYRVITARSFQGLHAFQSTTDLDVSTTPTVVVGQITRATVADIDHFASGMLGENPPPILSIRADGSTRCEVELATAQNLLIAGAAGRNAVNYFSSAAGAAGVPVAVIDLQDHLGSYEVPEPVWRALGAIGPRPFIFFHISTFTLDAGGNQVAVATSALNADHSVPGLWTGLPIDGTHAGFIDADGRLVTSQLSSDHGPRTLPVGVAGRIWHPGIDIPLNNAAVYAVADGVIDHTDNALGWVRIDHATHKTSYLHMNIPFAAGVAGGRPAREGQLLSTSDTRGTASPHLHLELDHSGKNPLARLRHTETGAPWFISSLAPGLASDYSVEMKNALAGTDPMAILGFGVTTGGDKDLACVCVAVLDRFDNVEPSRGYFLSYGAIRTTLNAAGMLQSTGTFDRTPRLLYDASPRLAGLPALTAATRREFYILDNLLLGNPPPPPQRPVAAYGGLRGGMVDGRVVGRFDMYVIPGFTDRNNDAEDWFHYMWHFDGYGAATGPHRLVMLATDLKGNTTALTPRFGVELASIAEQATPAQVAVDFPVRLQLLDHQAATVDVVISGAALAAGWTAVGDWAPPAPVALAAGQARFLRVQVTPPVGAVGFADIQITARSRRLTTCSDVVTLRTNVGPAPAVPSVAASATLALQDGPAPFFHIRTARDSEAAVEVSTDRNFFDGSAARNDLNTFSSRRGAPLIPGQVLHTVTDALRYELPQLAWDRLTGLPITRLYYRTLTSPDPTWNVVHQSAISQIDIQPAWPQAGPTITPLYPGLNLNAPAPALPFGIPPAFLLRVAPGTYFAVEVATEQPLFDDERHRVNEHNFFSSWFGSSVVPPRQLFSKTGWAVYQVPEPAWDRLRPEFAAGRAVQLYYIVRQAYTPGELFGTVHSSSFVAL